MTSDHPASGTAPPAGALNAAPDTGTDGAVPDWDAIRLAYETTAEPVAAIARRFGVTPSALYSRRARRRWQMRRPGAATRSATAEGQPPPTAFAQHFGELPSLTTPEGRRSFKDRLYHAINWTYSMAEQQIATNPDAPDAVKTMKSAIEAATRDLERVDKIDARDPKSDDARADPEPWYEVADPDQFRQALAERILALCEEWEAKGDPGGDRD